MRVLRNQVAFEIKALKSSLWNQGILKWYPIEQGLYYGVPTIKIRKLKSISMSNLEESFGTEFVAS